MSELQQLLELEKQDVALEREEVIYDVSWFSRNFRDFIIFPTCHIIIMFVCRVFVQAYNFGATGPILMKLCMCNLHYLRMLKTKKKIFIQNFFCRKFKPGLQSLFCLWGPCRPPAKHGENGAGGAGMGQGPRKSGALVITAGRCGRRTMWSMNPLFETLESTRAVSLPMSSLSGMEFRTTYGWKH